MTNSQWRGVGLLAIALLQAQSQLTDPELEYPAYTPKPTDLILSRSKYMEQLQGFWLTQCIANWTGLITEMDKIEPPFYTDENWDGPDERNIWGNFISTTDTIIEYYFVGNGEAWAADDDTDIEYMYQHLMDVNNVSILTPEQIRDGWLHHIYSNEDAPNNENFLWVSNETAYYLMLDGLLPPATSAPDNNSHYEMIDAQLTTEIFGLFAPTRPDIALRMSHMPIRTTANGNAKWAAEFYVVMYSLASYVENELSMKEKVFWLAKQARKRLPDGTPVAGMYDYIKASYDANPDKNDWESTRDAVYERYQVGGGDGYVYNQSFDSGINFAASLISLFYGEGDLPRTIKIGSLTGWDSDNPTATWGGLLGFMLGKNNVEWAFEKDDLSETYWISRTRRNFPDQTPVMDGEDTFSLMAKRGIYIIDRVVIEELDGGVDLEKDVWYIPDHGGDFPPGTLLER